MIYCHDELGIMVYGDTDDEAHQRLSAFMRHFPDIKGSWTRVDHLWLAWNGRLVTDPGSGFIESVDTTKWNNGKLWRGPGEATST